MSSVGIIAVAFANGEPCPHEGQWVRSFDHDACEGQGYGVFTDDASCALPFADVGEAWNFWAKQSSVRPTRPDGRPNKPMTALTVSIEPLP